ncbi:polyketide synthase [Colletotrichum tabaci]|uniref:Polyketide synthase n=1 Tax=Colletotrichum tabaci TaxID=1209068 RepID=A0AAV9T2D3_9PEZI
MFGGWSIGGRLPISAPPSSLARTTRFVVCLSSNHTRTHAPHLAANPGGVCVEHLETTGFFKWPGRPTAVPDWQKRHTLYCILLNSLYTPSPLRVDGTGGTIVPLELVWSAQGDF